MLQMPNDTRCSSTLKVNERHGTVVRKSSSIDPLRLAASGASHKLRCYSHDRQTATRPNRGFTFSKHFVDGIKENERQIENGWLYRSQRLVRCLVVDSICRT